MIEVALRRVGFALYPFSEEDRDLLAEFESGRVLRARITGAQKPRSHDQLKLYWACCRTVADNSPSDGLMTKEQVSFYVKVELKFIDTMIVKDGVVHVLPKSISFTELPHMEACNFFDRAFEIMAKLLGITVYELTEGAMETYW